MNTAKLTGAAILLVLAGGGHAAARGTLDGVYTAAQAAEGAAVYARQCAMCHGARLEGSVEVPGLTGKFVANWADRPVGDLYDYLARAMPQMAPGTLQPEDNARLVAFILQANGAPAGTRNLPAGSAALQRIVFDAPRGGG
jgi:mono/diheme cytochrome c family protein